MEIIVGGRQVGKTTLLLKWLLGGADRALLSGHPPNHYRRMLEQLVPDDQSRERTVNEAMSRVYRPMDFIPHGHDRREWAVDDIDIFLNQLVRGRVVRATSCDAVRVLHAVEADNLLEQAFAVQRELRRALEALSPADLERYNDLGAKGLMR